MNRVLAFRQLNPAPLKFATNHRAVVDLNLFLGVTVFGILPQVAAVAYYGVLLAGILIVSILTGTGLGLAMRHVAYGPQTLGINTSTCAEPITETLKKAA